MKKTLFIVTLAVLILSGCATQSISGFQSFQAHDLNTLLKSGELKQTKDNVFVINDSSSSMSNRYLGADFSGQAELTKLDVEKQILYRINQTIPNIALSSGVRSFGFGPCLDWGYTKLNQTVQSYAKASFAEAINSLNCSSGGTPVAAALTEAKTDLATTSGNIAVILLSDGFNYETSPVPALKKLKEDFGDRLCVYTVWVGNEKDSVGKAALQQLVDIAGCGFSTTASQVASSKGVADFVTNVFFTQSDVRSNSETKCANISQSGLVDKQGCWVSGVFFDFDQAVIKPDSAKVLNKVINILKQTPRLTIEIQGHTDSKGSTEYNQRLSEKRAVSVRHFLVNKGIADSRLTTMGHGESKPVASNDTDEGRARNRRVIYNRTDR